LRDFSQTPDDRDKERSEEEQMRLPEVPQVPDLPQAPELKPKLPALPKERVSEDARQYQRMGIAYTIPLSLIVPIVGLTLAGWWLDGRFHKSPWFTLGGSLIGTITGFINMIRMANKLND
jgi:F0F1-type ATP synthase assembly protein I